MSNKSDKAPTNPYVAATNITQTLFSEIMTSQHQVMTESINQLVSQTQRLLSGEQSGSPLDLHQEAITAQQAQLTNLSNELSQSINKAQQQYQAIFQLDSDAPAAKPAAKSATERSPTPAKPMVTKPVTPTKVAKAAPKKATTKNTVTKPKSAPSAAKKIISTTTTKSVTKPVTPSKVSQSAPKKVTTKNTITKPKPVEKSAATKKPIIKQP